MLKSVKKLEPGFAMIIEEKKINKKWCFYKPPLLQQISKISINDAKIKLRNSIKTAVERQMVSDVPVGTFLSGGLDSSAITAFAKDKVSNEKLKCFTISIDNKMAKQEGITNDLPYAESVAKHLGVDLLKINVGPEMVNELTKMIYHLDEPQADPASLNTLFISRLAAKHGIKVLLSGAGGDDIFSGYRRHRALMLEKYWSYLPLSFRNVMTSAAKKLPNSPNNIRRIAKAFRYANLDDESRIASYFNWLDPDTVSSLLSDDIREKLPTVNPLKLSLANIPDRVPPLNKMLYLEQKYYLADHNLNYTDKMSMAAGVEVRVPLLDQNLVELAARLPINYKQRGKEGKWIFKKAMEGILPNEVIYRPKTGFGAPIRSWINGPLKTLVRDVLSETSINNRQWFNNKAVKNLLIEDNQGSNLPNVKNSAANAFDVAIASGVFELFSDNTLVSTALAGINDSLAPNGYLLYTNQPWHPEQEFTSKTLNNHRGSSWVMRCRSQAEMDQLVTQAGFKKIDMRIDRFGIFTVSLAIKVD